MARATLEPLTSKVTRKANERAVTSRMRPPPP